MDEQSPETGQPRRSMRARRSTAKALDFDALNACRSRRRPLRETSSESERPDTSEDSDSADYELDRPATDTVSTNTALAGKEIYGFNKVKKHDRLLSTPRKEKTSRPKVPKTPHRLRQQLVKGIKSTLQSSSSDVEDDPFAEGGSEYFPSGSASSESGDSDDTPLIKLQERAEMPKLPSASAKTRGKGNKYVIKTEEYFSHTGSKVATSNHTLDKLTTPILSQDQLQKLLSQMKLSECHQRSIMTATQHNKEHFNKWRCLMHENFNVLVYGLGSKENLLNDFHLEALSDSPVIVINGYFPSLTLKDILDAIMKDLLELDENTANVNNAADVIAREFQTLDAHLYLVVHNIEGDMLRNNKCQNFLSRLSATPHVHLIASIDHINAPLIWDHNKLSKFNFVWFDVTSFLPYTDETSFENSMMVQRSGDLALSSLRNVFLSLTSNSKGIYTLVIKYQLEHNSSAYYQGMLFKDLYTACREAFLVSSDLALRAQLTEFVDHKMVKLKRSADGAEYLLIPIASNLLRQFLKAQCN